MSDTFLRIIPVEPSFVPAPDAAPGASDLLRDALPAAEDIDVRITDEVSFVDAGENFESISCPLCGAELDEDWWSEAVGGASDTDFAELEVTVPCCGGHTNLNELDYEMPQGFARFVLEAASPGIDQLPEALIRALSDIVGCEVRAIWARY